MGQMESKEEEVICCELGKFNPSRCCPVIAADDEADEVSIFAFVQYTNIFLD
jgi:hypothetical protein